MTNTYYCDNCLSCLFIEHNDDPIKHDVFVKEFDTCERCEMKSQGEWYGEC